MKVPRREHERRAAVRTIAEETFDLAEMTRRTLGPHWRERTEAERAEFVTLFGDLLDRAYFTRIAAYNGEKITVLGDSIDGDLATVRTRIVTQQGAEIPVDYRMLRRGDRWVVYDISIEGVSLVANYRAQFDRIIQASSYQALVDSSGPGAGSSVLILELAMPALAIPCALAVHERVELPGTPRRTGTVRPAAMSR